MKLSEIINILNFYADEAYALPWDNSGIQVGDKNAVIHKILICLDVTENVIDEAVQKKCDLIISHHPLLFNPVKSIQNDSISRILKKAIKNDINIYSSHTCFDMSEKGMNKAFADHFMLSNVRALDCCAESFAALEIYVAKEYAQKLCKELYNAGAIEVKSCVSYEFNILPNNRSASFANTKQLFDSEDKISNFEEIKLEITCAEKNINKLLDALYTLYPNKTPSYRIIKLNEVNYGVAMGIVGDLPEKISLNLLVDKVKEYFSQKHIRTSFKYEQNEEIKRIAFCSGSGSSYLGKAKYFGAQSYITADCKMPDFIRASQIGIYLICPSHFSSEHNFVALIRDLLVNNEVNIEIEISSQSDCETII